MCRTRTATVALVLAAMSAATGCASSAPSSVTDETARYSELVELPPPDVAGRETLESTLLQRRSHREFASRELEQHVIGQLLWAGQGITDDAGHRTAPSAGATYPLDLYVITASSVAHYVPDGHRLERRSDSTVHGELADAAFEQGFVGDAPTVFVITGSESRTAAKYGAVAHELMNREAGHAAQNILLQATALGLAAVPVGGFDPAVLARRLLLSPGEEVLYLLPIGYPADERTT